MMVMPGMISRILYTGKNSIWYDENLPSFSLSGMSRPYICRKWVYYILANNICYAFRTYLLISIYIEHFLIVVQQSMHIYHFMRNENKVQQ
jgi:hypothetical protein